jgi:hypothetical protein
MSARDEAVMLHWRACVSAAAGVFESRWTLLALRRVDDGLATRLLEQRSLFDTACVTGTADDIELHGPAMCRGYAAAVRALEQAGAADDAYVLGRCPRTGTVVAIGEQRAAVARVRELHGEAVVWITPDEVATLFASAEGFKMVGAVKRLWPGAELIDRHACEGPWPETGEAA